MIHFFKRPIKVNVNYTVVYRNTSFCPLNESFLHNVLCKVILESIKSLSIHKKPTNN